MSELIELQVVRKKKESSKAVSVFFKTEAEQMNYKPGQFVSFIFDDLGPTQIRRSYSISSTPNVDKYLAITVKQVPNGTVSSYLVETLKVGDKLLAIAPAGQFTFMPQEKTKRTIFLIGGGSGISPLFSILKAVLYYEQQSRIILINSNRNEAETIFYKDLQALAKSFPDRIRIIHLWTVFHTKDKAAYHQLKNVMVMRQRLSNDLLERLVRRNQNKRKADQLFYLCGPSGLLLKAVNTLRFMGFSKEQLKREIFVIKKPDRPEPSKLKDCQLQLNLPKGSLKIQLKAGQTVLEAAQNAGLSMAYSCLSGICTSCSGQCKKGKMDMYTQEGKLDTNQTNGQVLICVAYPTTKTVTIDFS